MPLPVATIFAVYRYALQRTLDHESSYLLNAVGKPLLAGRFKTHVETAEVFRGLLRLNLVSTREIPAQVMELYGLKLV